MKSIKELNINNETILIRVDFNVPLKDSTITSSFRIDQSLDTIKFCLKNNANVVLMSHLGRPADIDESLSLYPVYQYLNNIFPNKVFFSKDCVSDESIKKSNLLNGGQIHLLENLRYYSGELNNSSSFAEKLSKHAKIYVNDAFGTSHRKHASNSSILPFFKKKAIGFLMEKELNYLTKLKLENNNITLLLGGSKVSTKLSMIKFFLDKADNILVGGGMAFTFLKALGYNIGNSLYEDSMYEEAKNIIKYSKNSNTNIVFPKDFLCSNSLDSPDCKYRKVDEFNDLDMGFDIGDKTINHFSSIISNSNCLIWNGPLGVFEIKKYSKGTELLAKKIVSLTNDNSLISIIGGGDTASSVIDLNLESCFSHVSTGGGASLKLLSGKPLQLFESWESK